VNKSGHFPQTTKKGAKKGLDKRALKDKPDYLGHRERLRAKFKKIGLSEWQDYEILEFILNYCIARKDTKPAAKALLRKFKTIGSVLDADEEDLQSVPGMGPASAALLKLFRGVSEIYLKSRLKKTDSLSSPGAVYDYLAVSLKGKKEEEFKVIFLNSANRPVEIETLQVGTVDKSAIYPRKVVARALKHSAVSLIVAHNHPGGSLKPSQDDIRITEALTSALSTVDISLLDHIIISDEGYLSFKEKGLL
jgi:DNA repair protein RadC